MKEPLDAARLETIKDVIEGLKDEYFSDLNVLEIGDDEVSDVNEDDLNIDSVPLH